MVFTALALFSVLSAPIISKPNMPPLGRIVENEYHVSNRGKFVEYYYEYLFYRSSTDTSLGISASQINGVRFQHEFQYDNVTFVDSDSHTSTTYTGYFSFGFKSYDDDNDGEYDVYFYYDHSTSPINVLIYPYCTLYYQGASSGSVSPQPQDLKPLNLYLDDDTDFEVPLSYEVPSDISFTSFDIWLDVVVLPDNISSAEPYQNGYDTGYTQGHADGYQGGHTDGYDDGYDDGYHEGQTAGESIGYADGYNDAISQGTDMATIFQNIFQVGVLPVNVFLHIMNFEVFGINISSLVSGLITVALTIILLRFILGGSAKGDN